MNGMGSSVEWTLFASIKEYLSRQGLAALSEVRRKRLQARGDREEARAGLHRCESLKVGKGMALDSIRVLR
eukprot:259065-Hanusia_phi.AAC.3